MVICIKGLIQVCLYCNSWRINLRWKVRHTLRSGKPYILMKSMSLEISPSVSGRIWPSRNSWIRSQFVNAFFYTSCTLKKEKQNCSQLKNDSFYWPNVVTFSHRDKVSPEEKRNATAKALELSLKYNFVTPLTSMVVTKPESDDSFIADKLTEGTTEHEKQTAQHVIHNWCFTLALFFALIHRATWKCSK